MTTVYLKTSNPMIRRLAKRFKVPFDDIVRVEIEPTHVTIYYTENYDDLNGVLTISCTKVIYDSGLAHHLSHA